MFRARSNDELTLPCSMGISSCSSDASQAHDFSVREFPTKK